jgi:hypothetical protein
MKLVGTMLENMRPNMEKRCEIASKPKEVEEILCAGTEKARKVAAATLQEAKVAMKIA